MLRSMLENTRYRNLLLVCILLSTLVAYKIIYSYQVTVTETVIVKKHKDKLILFWDEMWSFDDFLLGLGSKIFDSCPVKNCLTTRDTNLVAIEEFDAVVFHGVTYIEKPEKDPPKRGWQQVYIYLNMESPFNTPSSLKFAEGFFNWTMTFRSDSEVQRPYGRILANNTDYQLPTVEEIRKRPKKISWFVSHCGVPSKRDELAKKINQHMPVDIYGKCGTLQCSRDKFDECYSMIERDYKFYLSFENSFCKDYVTEKLFNILKMNIIPIVYGGADYEKIAPPHSVIDVTKFKTVKELVNYLNFLDQNPEEYLKYFEWKRSFSVDTTPQGTLCQLCQRLNEPRKKIIYEDIVAWVNYPGYCKSGDSLPPIVFS